MQIHKKELDKSAFDLAEIVAKGEKNPKETEALLKHLEQRYRVYTDSITNQMSNSIERQAGTVLRKFMQPTSKPFLGGLESALDKFDTATNFWKANVLGLNTEWLKTTFYEAASKSFLEGGFLPAVQTVRNVAGGLPGLKLLQSNLAKNMSKVLGNEINYKDVSKDILDMKRRGALSSPNFIALEDEAMQQLVKDERKFMDQLAERKVIIEREYTNIGRPGPAPKEVVTKAMNAWVNGIPKRVMKLGHYVEGQGRLATYRSMVDTIKSNPASKGLTTEAIKDIAADYVNRVFFDYKDLNMFENVVMKRIMPFYSFISKNVPYWVDKVYDMQALPKVKAVMEPYKHVGENVTEEEALSLSPYIKENAPRYFGENKAGHKIYGIPKGVGITDALKMVGLKPSALAKEILSSTNPFLTAPIELTSYALDMPPGGTDFFTTGWNTIKIPKDYKDMYGINDDEFVKMQSQQPALAGASGREVKQLWSSGAKWWLLNETLGMIDEKTGITALQTILNNYAHANKVDISNMKNPETQDFLLSFVDKLSNTLFPHPLFNQISGYILKWNQGKSDIYDILKDALLPMDYVSISPDAEAFNISQYHNDIKKYLDNKYRLQIKSEEAQESMKDLKLFKGESDGSK